MMLRRVLLAAVLLLTGCTTSDTLDRGPQTAGPAPMTGPTSAPFGQMPDLLSSATPALYDEWLRQGDNGTRVALFEAELQRRALDDVAPTYQLLRTAMDWPKCGAPFALPDPSAWEGAFASLTVLKRELVPLVGRVEVVSGYRDEAMNLCAGGAKGSVHRIFGAFDVFAVDPAMTREAMIARLCKWHDKQGRPDEAGLGIYSGKKFHIDAGVRGYRRWGPDYSSKTSPCGVIAKG